MDERTNMHFTWASFFAGESIINYGVIDPLGNTLREAKELSTDTGRFHNPVITRTAGGLMHVFWFNEPKDKEQWSTILMKTSEDDGMTWHDWRPQQKDE
jgi:hypothetical protein